MNIAQKRTQTGITTSNLITSALVGTNEQIFPDILKLHVPTGSVIADVTYGKGVFWKNVCSSDYSHSQ